MVYVSGVAGTFLAMENSGLMGADRAGSILPRPDHRARCGSETEAVGMLMRLKHGPVVLASRDSKVGAMVTAALASLGPQAPRLSAVGSMAECVTATRMLRPSVVVLDDAIADSPGPHLCTDLQATQPGIHIVYIASRHTLELEREIRRQGVLFYVARPMESESLESTLSRILKGLLRSTN